MSDYTRNYDFQAGDVISSSEIDEEFNDVATAIASKPDADGTVQSSLNADQVDGFDAADDGGTGTIPICSGAVQTGLNAEFVGGLSASDLAEAGFVAGTAMLFYQSSAPTRWTKSANPTVDRVVGISDSGTGGSDSARTSWFGPSTDFTVTVASHTLTTAEIPPVGFGTLGIGGFTADGGSTGPVINLRSTYALASVDSANVTPTGTTAGGGGSHTHAGSTVTRSSAYRPPIRWCIICTKD